MHTAEERELLAPYINRTTDLCTQCLSQKVGRYGKDGICNSCIYAKERLYSSILENIILYGNIDDYKCAESLFEKYVSKSKIGDFIIDAVNADKFEAAQVLIDKYTLDVCRRQDILREFETTYSLRDEPRQKRMDFLIKNGLTNESITKELHLNDLVRYYLESDECYGSVRIQKLLKYTTWDTFDLTLIANLNIDNNKELCDKLDTLFRLGMMEDFDFDKCPDTTCNSTCKYHYSFRDTNLGKYYLDEYSR